MSLEYVNLKFGEALGCICLSRRKKKRKKKNIKNKVSSTPLRSVGDNIMSCERDDPCTCAGIKCDYTRNKIFLVTSWLQKEKKGKNMS